MDGDGPGSLPLPDPGFDHFLVVFEFAAAMLTPTGSVQTLKIVDFDPIYPKVQIPHFSKKNRSNKN